MKGKGSKRRREEGMKKEKIKDGNKVLKEEIKGAELRREKGKNGLLPGKRKKRKDGKKRKKREMKGERGNEKEYKRHRKEKWEMKCNIKERKQMGGGGWERKGEEN